MTANQFYDRLPCRSDNVLHSRLTISLTLSSIALVMDDTID